MSSSADNATAIEHAYVVNGMTCGHCVLSVREEVSELEGVELRELDLASGRLLVGGPAAGSVDAIRTAVEAAGYTLEPA